MQRYVQPLGLKVTKAAMPDSLALGMVTTASTGAPANLSTTSQPSVILKSTQTPLSLSSLTIDAGLTLELAPATTITLDGPLTNHATIVVPETSSFTPGINAVVTSGTSGTLTDGVPAAVGALQVTSPVAVGGLVEASASFTDSPLDTHDAVWSWGDGTTDELAVDATTRTASASHQYANAGAYTVELVVRDAAGNASGPVTATVVVAQTCPKDGNHGAYVSCIARSMTSGLGKGKSVSEAAKSNIGKPSVD